MKKKGKSQFIVRFSVIAPLLFTKFTFNTSTFKKNILSFC